MELAYNKNLLGKARPHRNKNNLRFIILCIFQLHVIITEVIVFKKLPSTKYFYFLHDYKPNVNLQASK